MGEGLNFLKRSKPYLRQGYSLNDYIVYIIKQAQQLNYIDTNSGEVLGGLHLSHLAHYLLPVTNLLFCATTHSIVPNILIFLFMLTLFSERRIYQ